MISPAQEKLAEFIASTGIWGYKGVIQLLENKKHSTVEHLKQAAQDLTDRFLYANLAPGSVTPKQRAYMFARIATEQNVCQFSRAMLSFMRQDYSELYKKDFLETKSALIERGVWPVSAEHQQHLIDEMPVYMEKRVEMCLKK